MKKIIIKTNKRKTNNLQKITINVKKMLFINIMNSIILCIFLIISITFIILYIYYIQDSRHKFQVAKIKALEQKYEMKNKELEMVRSKTQQCPVPNLRDPRSCYFGSNYNCSWNELIGRCDLICD